MRKIHNKAVMSPSAGTAYAPLQPPQTAALNAQESLVARQDTRLESEGAEFLVLGQFLIHKIAAYKTYTNMPGYDLVATSPENNTSAKIQVKSRWATKAGGFPIKNFDCDFVVVVLLNRGSKDGRKNVLPPEHFVIPVDVVQSVCRTNTSWSKVLLKDIVDLDGYRDNWDLVRDFLSV